IRVALGVTTFSGLVLFYLLSGLYALSHLYICYAFGGCTTLTDDEALLISTPPSSMPKYAAIGFCVFARRRLFFSASMPFIPQTRPVSTTPRSPFRAAPSSDTSHSFMGPTPSAGGLFLCLSGLKGASMSQLPLSVTHSPAFDGRPSRIPGARAPRA